MPAPRTTARAACGAAAAAYCLYRAWQGSRRRRLEVLRKRDEPKDVSDALMAACPSLSSPLRGPLGLLLGPYEQFAVLVLNEAYERLRHGALAFEREVVVLPDGGEVALDVLATSPAVDATAPVAVICHSIAGNATSNPGLVRALARRGYVEKALRVLRLCCECTAATPVRLLLPRPRAAATAAASLLYYLLDYSTTPISTSLSPPSGTAWSAACGAATWAAAPSFARPASRSSAAPTTSATSCAACGRGGRPRRSSPWACRWARASWRGTSARRGRPRPWWAPC